MTNIQRRGFLATCLGALFIPLGKAFAGKPKGIRLPVMSMDSKTVKMLEVTLAVPIAMGDFLYKGEDGLYWPVSSWQASNNGRANWEWYLDNCVGYAMVTVGYGMPPEQTQKSIAFRRKQYGLGEL
jgi:hypothetical protein